MQMEAVIGVLSAADPEEPASTLTAGATHLTVYTFEGATARRRPGRIGVEA